LEIYRKTKETLTALEFNHDDILHFELADGKLIDLHLIDSAAEIMSTTLEKNGLEVTGAMTTYRFWANFVINGKEHRLVREVGTQKSFYEPWLIEGAHIWLDAVDAIFDFMNETHSPCRTQEIAGQGDPLRRQVRIAIQDAGRSICPERIAPWCPLPENCLRIEDCYRGEDCWMGAYDGASAHGGLDINHPSGTPLYAPINIDDHFLFNSVQNGSNNNRWRGIRRWDDGSTWILTTCHMNHLTLDENTPIQSGQQYADGAGVWVGCHEHSHFGFSCLDHGELILLDPWILFWQMYQDLNN